MGKTFCAWPFVDDGEDSGWAVEQHVQFRSEMMMSCFECLTQSEGLQKTYIGSCLLLRGEFCLSALLVSITLYSRWTYSRWGATTPPPIIYRALVRPVAVPALGPGP